MKYGEPTEATPLYPPPPSISLFMRTVSGIPSATYNYIDVVLLVSRANLRFSEGGGTLKKKYLKNIEISDHLAGSAGKKKEIVPHNSASEPR